MRTTQKPSLHLLAAALVAGGAVMAHAPTAHADEVSPTGKGITGGALLGAEAVTIVESLAGARPAWAYLLGGGLGAVGGGIGGYFVEQGSTDGRVPVYMLAGGLALIIPAIVLTLNATRYMPDENATEDKAPTNGPDANPGTPSTSPPPVSGNVSGTVDTGPATTPVTPSTPAPAPVPASPSTPTTPPPAGGGGGGGGAMSLFHAGQGGFGLGVPVPTVKPMWTTAEQQRLGVQQGTEVRVAVLHVTF